MERVQLTYCGNVHPAGDLEEWLATVHRFAVPVAAAQRRRGLRFGLGAWWNAAVAQTLAGDPAARARLSAELAALDLPLWTLNVFPFGGFHDAVVKRAVYAPDWATEERLDYTRQCARVAAGLLPMGSTLPLSTLPLGYRGPGDAPADLRLMARNLVRCASSFAAIEQQTGVRCTLALEPEPFCLLETCAAAADFLERWVFDEGAWSTVTTEVLRRHLGVCVDLCHLAVVGEEPLAALALLAARGIVVPKVQVSSCLELRAPAELAPLLAFDEPRYLHQTVAERGPRALDLGDVRARTAEFTAGGRLRTHFHMPLYWDQPGALGSTRSEVERVLRGLRAMPPPLPLLEVETYTWSVLGDLAGSEPLPLRIGRELEFVANLLGV